MRAVIPWAAPNGRRYLISGCEDNNIYFVDPETGEADEARTLRGSTEVRSILLITIIAIIISRLYSML